MGEFKSKRTITCPYCRGIVPQRDSEKDHVPPKGLFGKPRPSNLITVRCCGNCHDAMSKGDEVLKAISVIGLVRTDARVHIKDEVDRALRANPWWKRQLVDSATTAVKVAVSYRGLTAVGYRVPMTAEFSAALDNTIRRIAIGLLFHADPGWDATKHSFEVVQANEETPIKFIETFRNLGSLPHRVSLGQGVFHAAWGFAQNSSDHGVMIISFFGGLLFAVFIEPKA